MKSDSHDFPAAPEVIERALAASKADHCQVIVEEGWGVNVRFAVNTTTSNGRRRSRTVTVVSFVDGPQGTSAGSVTRTGNVNIDELVAESEATARTAPPSPDAHAYVVGGADREFSRAPEETGYDELSSVVAALVRTFPAAERSGVTFAGYVEHTQQTTYLGTSTGLRRRFAQPTGGFQLNGRADGGRRSAWTSAATPDLASLDVDAHVSEIHRRLGWAETSVALPAGRYETILPPIAVADLMLYLYWSMSARDAADGRTVFSRKGGGTRIGERLSVQPFDLTSDPADQDFQCSPFLVTRSSNDIASVFDNGAALERTAWMTGGMLAHLFAPRADAARIGIPFAAPIDNLTLTVPGAKGTTEDLVSRTERGLLVTCLWYIREVDPATLLLTGLTRDGVYLIEDGRVTGAVNNFRFNESPVDILARAVEVGAATRTMSREWGDEFNRTRMPPLRIPDFNMSSVSPAN